ncbi:MAG: hypothetical protein ABIB61_04060 [Candidatus Shapirobacteria bacterium]
MIDPKTVDQVIAKIRPALEQALEEIIPSVPAMGDEPLIKPAESSENPQEPAAPMTPPGPMPESQDDLA